MISEAEITEQTGIMYLRDDAQREDASRFSGTFPVKAVNLLNPTFTTPATGEDTKTKSHIESEFPASLLACRHLATTTGSELHAVDIVVVFEAACTREITDYHVIFDYINFAHISHATRYRDHLVPLEKSSVTAQADRLREVSGLKIERLAKIFNVSRPTYYKWIAGSPLREEHREHLLEVLPIVEEANQRLGGSDATNNWLLTPVSPGGKKPIDYLATHEYATFRGFLLHVRTGHEVFRPLAPTHRVHIERSPEEFEDALERLRPRVWRDDERNEDTNAFSRDNEEA